VAVIRGVEMDHPGVFVDKDGTLVENVPYNVETARIALMPGAVEGLGLLRRAGYRIVVVSNQSGVARGYFSEEALVPVERRIRELLASGGVTLDGFVYCPHHPEGSLSGYALDCECRKPRPGLLVRAAARYEIGLRESWMVGDILDDVEAGHAAGCRSVLVDTGNETEWVWSPARMPDATARDLLEAARLILARDAAPRLESVP
jgi:D-glycero-D-manno-heptose 1,7-bisphosphate phosphatase